METIKKWLLRLSEARFREMLETLEGVTEEAAYADRRPDWPGHNNHVAQDGSIAGIAHHVAAWKQAFLEYLRGRYVDYRTVGPANPTFAELLAWLRQAGQEWLAEAAAVPESELEKPLDLPGLPGHAPWYTPLNMIQEMLDHETEHLGQINYLREAHRCAPASRS
jgi:uncharacterized damage-inducible protein DinB